MAAPVPTRRSDGRSGRRIPQILPVELSRPDESVPQEMTFTENVGLHGARKTGGFVIGVELSGQAQAA